MNKQVTITAQPALKADGTANPLAGQVFTQSLDANGAPKMDKNGEETGYIRAEQSEFDLSFAYNGGLKTRSILVPMLKSAALKAIAEGHIGAGKKIDGQIVREDSTTPFYVGQKPMRAPLRDANNKVIAGEFKTITSGGLPVYRNEFFDKSGKKEDVKLASYDVIEKVGAAKEKASTVLAD